METRLELVFGGGGQEVPITNLLVCYIQTMLEVKSCMQASFLLGRNNCKLCLSMPDESEAGDGLEDCLDRVSIYRVSHVLIINFDSSEKSVHFSYVSPVYQCHDHGDVTQH